MIDLRSYELQQLALYCMTALICFQIIIIYPAILIALSSTIFGTPFFTWSSLMKIITINLFHAILIYFFTLNLTRMLVFYPWIKYFGPFISQWETFVLHDDGFPLFYIDVNGYTSLTEYFDDHVARAKANKDNGPDEHAYFKFARKSKRNMMTSVPNTIKRLVENNCLEIRTKPCSSLSHEHFQMLYDHTIATEISHGGEKGSNLWEILTENGVLLQWAQLGFQTGVMDEFWVNGKMVAFQTSVVVGEVLVDGTWAVLPEARQLRLYFEANRLLMKRAIADPSVKYINLQVMDLEKENLCLPKRKMFARQIVAKSEEEFRFCGVLCGFPDYVVTIENFGLWLQMFGSVRMGKEFWGVKDKSDLY